MTVGDDVNFEEIARSTDEFNGAQLKAVCVEAGMIALREGATKLHHEHFHAGIAEGKLLWYFNDHTYLLTRFMHSPSKEEERSHVFRIISSRFTLCAFSRYNSFYYYMPRQLVHCELRWLVNVYLNKSYSMTHPFRDVSVVIILFTSHIFILRVSRLFHLAFDAGRCTSSLPLLDDPTNRVPTKNEDNEHSHDSCSYETGIIVCLGDQK